MNFPDKSADNDDKESEPVRIKLKWKVKKDDETNGGYDENILMSLFEKVTLSDIFSEDSFPSCLLSTYLEIYVKCKHSRPFNILTIWALV